MLMHQFDFLRSTLLGNLKIYHFHQYVLIVVVFFNYNRLPFIIWVIIFF